MRVESKLGGINVEVYPQMVSVNIIGQPSMTFGRPPSIGVQEWEDFWMSKSIIHKSGCRCDCK